jgi:hypothetical protein
MTLIVGCGGSSSPGTTTCDGGNCSDAKGDTGAKLDGAKLDGAKLDTQVSTDGPAPKLDGPAPKLDGPAANLDVPPANLDVPAANLDVPAANLDVPPANLDVPPANLDVPPANLDVPPANLDVPPANLDVPPANLDVRPPDVTIGGQDVRPPDAITPPHTDAADAAGDTTPVIHDAGPTDSSADTTPVIVDAADAGPDGSVAVVVDAADAAGDAGPDGLVVLLDAQADGVADSPEVDAPVVDGGSNDGPICEGDVCHAYTFEGNNLDGGTLPTGFQAVAGGSAGVWSLVMDGSNEVLQGVGTATPTYVETDIVSWTDQTIEVKVRFVNAPTTLGTGGDNTVRICGRFTASNQEGYCLYVTTVASDAGSAGGSMAIYKRTNGAADSLASVGGLDIMVGSWHTYRFSINGAGPVDLNAYLDGATTSTVNVTDNNIGSTTPAYLTVGGVAVGVRNITADVDNLTVTNP